MKKLTALVLSLILALSLASVSLADSVIAATNCAFPPYEFYEDGVEAGIDVEIVKAVCEKLGYDLTIVDTEFGSIITGVATGKYDIGFGAITITEGRSHDVDFSIPYAEEGSAFIYRAGEPMPTMVRAEGLRVGAVESMTHDFYLTRHGIDPFRYKAVEQAIEALRALEQTSIK